MNGRQKEPVFCSQIGRAVQPVLTSRFLSTFFSCLFDLVVCGVSTVATSAESECSVPSGTAAVMMRDRVTLLKDYPESLLPYLFSAVPQHTQPCWPNLVVSSLVGVLALAHPFQASRAQPKGLYIIPVATQTQSDV
jgi:hypothetical protein